MSEAYISPNTRLWKFNMQSAKAIGDGTAVLRLEDVGDVGPNEQRNAGFGARPFSLGYKYMGGDREDIRWQVLRVL